MTDNQSHDAEQQQQDRLEKFQLFIVKPEQIDQLWNSEDPNQAAQNLIQEHITLLSKEYQKDLNFYNEFERRYEPNQELKWLADYLIHSLILIKEEVQVTEEDVQSELLQVLWKTLDFLNIQDKIQNGGAAVHGRYNYLKDELFSLFNQKKLDVKQIQKVLDFAQRTFFSHLQLYLNCLSQKQAKKDKPVKIIVSAPLFSLPGGLDSKSCQEIHDEYDMKEGSQLGEGPNLDRTFDNESKIADEKSVAKEDDAADEFKPDDPLYGLDQRLRLTNLDEQTKHTIKAKLIEQQNKIKEILEQRQIGLDQKIAAQAGGAKKK